MPAWLERWHLALACGLIAGIVDLHVEEVTTSVLLLYFLSLGWGAAAPQRVWRWALAIGAGIPVAHILSSLVGYQAPYPTLSLAATSLALLPTFAGAFLGKGLRIWIPRWLGPSSRRPSPPAG